MAPGIGLGGHKREVEAARAEAPQLNKVKWWKDAGLRKLYALCMVVCLASATTGYDGSMLNGLQILPVWQTYFNHPAGPLLGLFGSIYSIGSLAGLPFAPFIADRYGRKTSIWAGCAILFVGVAVQSAAQDFKMFVASRFFVGFGCTLAQLSSPLLLTEIAHPQHRGAVTAVYNCLWNLGAIVATWLTYGTFNIQNNWAWRIPSILQALPSLGQFCLLFWVPESPRWLIKEDRGPEALKILAKYHANGDETDETVLFEYAEIKETLRLEYQFKKQSSYLDFFRTKGNRYRFFLIGTLGLFSQWSGNGLTSYYFAKIMDSIGVTDPDTQFKINGSLTIMSLIISVSCAFLIDRVGRRPLFITATAGMLITFVIWTICTALFEDSGNLGAGKAVIAMIFLFSATYAFAWSGLLVAYTVEIMPFKLRAKGLMVMNFFVQVALVFNQYINPIGLARLNPQWKFYTIYCCWIAVELVVVYFFYIETKGPTLEEIAKIFDGEDADVGLADFEDVKHDMRGVTFEEKEQSTMHVEATAGKLQ
ncbi:hypothetical protein LTR91_005840 [Friedmanniomyces endolithicus]|uniref:Major facilitator superfamily (MFS) profile domain-containing protein n=3 Tax=Dothideomycetidae TaxID=451867 RepID=A0AAN6KS74_9PEZI|nr:hypothetical protein LTR94_000731 [Friedmanniomyces endolithicus]KAK0815370.1 hypothetical protein LTR59_000443 [Friedmanniomyces endolithicus]KAK0817255.1 hypothetical protein LTR75_003235 [Friedmanniomyces endolithicus]KAK0818157.1 hypothetical protein LTR38_001204 [Friedmanniomyces endolithicus]KAK0856736.1 hypothetical protein LTR03_001073 [Friedmanniomyces endolithicus]